MKLLNVNIGPWGVRPAKEIALDPNLTYVDYDMWSNIWYVLNKWCIQYPHTKKAGPIFFEYTQPQFYIKGTLLDPAGREIHITHKNGHLRSRPGLSCKGLHLDNPGVVLVANDIDRSWRYTEDEDEPVFSWPLGWKGLAYHDVTASNKPSSVAARWYADLLLSYKQQCIWHNENSTMYDENKQKRYLQMLLGISSAVREAVPEAGDRGWQYAEELTIDPVLAPYSSYTFTNHKESWKFWTTFDLACRCFMVNPDMPDAIEQTRGIALIRSPFTKMRRFMKKLSKVFPYIQFIVCE